MTEPTTEAGRAHHKWWHEVRFPDCLPNCAFLASVLATEKQARATADAEIRRLREASAVVTIALRAQIEDARALLADTEAEQ